MEHEIERAEVLPFRGDLDRYGKPYIRISFRVPMDSDALVFIGQHIGKPVSIILETAQVEMELEAVES